MVGLFGQPAHHSQSPVMHNAAFQALNLPFAYAAFEVSPERLPEAVAGIRGLGMRGVNVTIPHKVAIVPLLDEIDPLAKRIGAVNTVVNENGRLIGYNTDGSGYARSLLEETGIQLANQVVVMMGAGGAARAVACTLAEQGVKEIRIINRSRERAQTLVKLLAERVSAVVVEMEQAERAIQDAALLINTTSIGMFPQVDEMPVKAEWLHSNLVVSDLIYNPLETKLLKTAKALGCKIHSGVGMFINQGALAFELWTGKSAPTDVMRQTVLKQLQHGGT